MLSAKKKSVIFAVLCSSLLQLVTTAIVTMSMSLEEIVRQEARVLGYERLKPQQVRAVEAFVGGRKDVFVSLPTGYGKSLCFGLLPRVFDHIRGVKERSSLIQDQCSTFNKMGLSAAYVGSCDNDVRRRMKEGEYQLLFACPEVFFA